MLTFFYSEYQLGPVRYNKCALSFPYVFWNSADDFIGVIGSPVAGTNILCCNLSIVNNLPCIIMIYGGSYAEQMEDLTDATVVEEFMTVLHRVYGNSIPAPIDYSVSRWGKDRYAKGSFSYIPPGVDGFQELRKMSEPIYAYDKQDIDRKSKVPCLLFAGEATSPFHPSTIHGAFCSGIREAYRLDLSFSPEMNNHMVFEEEVLYRGTFGIRRRFEDSVAQQLVSPSDKTKEAALHHTPNSHRIGSRRSIRKQIKIVKDDEEKKTCVVRKSKRIKGTESKYLRIAKSDEEPNEITSGGLVNVEDTAILRGVDVYGRDLEGMKNINRNMFPVPNLKGLTGDRRAKSNEAIYQRYRKLVSDGADGPPAMDDEIAYEWLASHDSNVWWESISNTKTSKNTSEGTKTVKPLVRSRKSTRKGLKRDIMDL